MRLPILDDQPKTEQQLYQEKIKAKWNHVSCEKMDPSKTACERERVKRTLEILELHCEIKGSKIVDLGCGSAKIAKFLQEKGGNLTLVDAVDHMKNPDSDGFASQIEAFPGEILGKAPGMKEKRTLEASKHPEDEGVKPKTHVITACLPYVNLPEDFFDGVVCTDVLAEIDAHLHRLTLSEISALLKRDGWFICSTPLDLYSYDALEQFFALLKTEFDLKSFKMSYHRLLFYLTRSLKAPQRFAKAEADPLYRLNQLKSRSGLLRLWFYLNSSKWLSFFWKCIARPSNFLKKKVDESRRLLLILERLSVFFFGRYGLTHVIVLARKKKI